MDASVLVRVWARALDDGNKDQDANDANDAEHACNGRLRNVSPRDCENNEVGTYHESSIAS